MNPSQSPRPFILPDVLVVDDTPENLKLLHDILAGEYEVRLSYSGRAALDAIAAQPPDLILLDIRMPGLDGFAAAKILKADPRTRDIPIIFISAMDDMSSKLQAFEIGGVDYITKPFHHREVLARVRTHLALRGLRGELERANARLVQQVAELQARNQELDAFAHTVAHDLKNPLSNMIWATHLLHRECAARENTADLLPMLAISLRTVETMDRAVEGLMLLSGLRKQAVTPAPLEMGSLVQRALECLTHLIGQRRAEIRQPENWPVALGYIPWVEEVWVNYISNAVKYGGNPESGQPPRVELGYDLPAAGSVRFWVRDNGVGLPPEKQALLFTPFERLQELRVQGHGLGLSIVRRIVEKLGGQVGVESAVGQGSRFYFTLPAG